VIVRYEFNLFDQTRGGMSESAAKVEAARKNGNRGGRPSDRSLIDRVLNRQIERELPKEVLPWDQRALSTWPQIRDKVLSRVPPPDRKVVTSYFGCDWMDIPMRSWKRLPSSVRRVLRQIRAAAKIHFSTPVRFSEPKPWVVIRVNKNKAYESEEHWKISHPNMPWCPTVNHRLSFSKLEGFWWDDMKYKSGDRLTEEDIFRNGDNKLTKEQARAIWLWLNWKYRPNKPPAKKRRYRMSKWDKLIAEAEAARDAMPQDSVSDKGASERSEVDDNPMY
jgi:hypothetical protein